MIQNTTTVNNDLFGLYDKSTTNNLSSTLILDTDITSFQFQIINSKNKRYTQEIFRDIKDYEGHYQISNLGAVKSLKRNSERVISPSIDKTKGYYRVCLYKNNKRKSFYIHQLVAIAFLEHKPNGNSSVVDHINNDKTNNELDNLQIVSSRKNSSKDQWRRSPTSRYTGVYWSPAKNKWESSIFSNRASYHLGCFNNESIAGQEYVNALEYINKHSNLTSYPFKTKRRNMYSADIKQLTFVFA
jgi:hypothetical protein